MNQVIVLLRLAGKQRFITSVEEAKMSMRGLATTVDATGKHMTLTGRRTWLFNQALFTLRRLAYGVTLGFIAAGAVLVKWGFEFNSQMNNARVGLEGFLPTERAVNDELKQMYKLAAITPFNFPDILMATRRLIPFTQNVSQANSLMLALTNSLSAVGAASGQYLTRATLQFTHILALGKVTGIQLNALSRDQIQLIPMLAAFYHTTTAAVVDMVHKGLVPANDAIQALIQFQTTAGYKNKNFEMSTRTLSGAWATFQDIMRFAMGGQTKGLFDSFRQKIIDIDKAMLPLIQGNRPITLDMIVEKIDKGLSPATHLVVNLFNLFKGILIGVVTTLAVFLKFLRLILTPFNMLASRSHEASTAMKILGYWLGFNLGLFIITRGVLYAVAIATYFVTAAENIYTAAKKVGTFWTIASSVAANVYLIYLELMTGGIVAATAATLGLAGAEYAALAPFILIIAAVFAAVIVFGLLYWKWDRFHRLVDKTAKFLWKWWPLLAFVPIIGPLLIVIKLFSRLVGWIEKLINLGKRLRNWFKGSGFGKALGFGAGLIGMHGFQHGGVVQAGGSFMVGESGPEIVHLPRGAAVTPNSAIGGAGGAFALTIEPAPIYVDGRMIAEVVWKHRLDRVARR